MDPLVFMGYYKYELVFPRRFTNARFFDFDLASDINNSKHYLNIYMLGGTTTNWISQLRQNVFVSTIEAN